MRGFNSLTIDQTCAPCIGGAEFQRAAAQLGADQPSRPSFLSTLVAWFRYEMHHFLRTVWWTKCVLLLSLAAQGVITGRFDSLTCLGSSLWQSKTALGARGERWQPLLCLPSEQDFFNDYTETLCGLTTHHEDRSLNTSARFSVTWKHLAAGRSKCPFPFAVEQAQSSFHWQTVCSDHIHLIFPI